MLWVSLDAVGGGQDDGGVAGEQGGAAAVPALVTPEHGHVPRDLSLSRLAAWTENIEMIYYFILFIFHYTTFTSYNMKVDTWSPF